MGAGEVIVTIVAILVGGALAFAILVLMFGNRLTKQEMEDRLDKEAAKDRKKIIEKVKEQRLKDKKEITESIKNIDISRKAESIEKTDPEKLKDYMEIFPEIPKKKKTTRKSSTKKVTK